MSNPLLKGEVSKTLKRTADNRLALQTPQCCSSCSETTSHKCVLYGRADACYEILDSSCNRVYPPSIYFCAKREGGTDADIPRRGATTIRGGVCYSVTGQTYTETQLIAAGIDPSRFDGDFVAVSGLSCASPLCGTAPDICGCLCHTWSPAIPQGGTCQQPQPLPVTDPGATFCCFGKRDGHGIVHFDFNYTRKYQERWTFTQRAPRCPEDPGNEDLYLCCASGADCVMFEENRRNCTEPGCKQFCVSGCGDPGGCCEGRIVEKENPIDKTVFGGGGEAGFPGCSQVPPFYTPRCMCGCPNHPRWEGWIPANYMIEACIPANTGTYTVVYDCPGYTENSTGCLNSSREIVTVTVTSTCSHVGVYSKREFYGPMVGHCTCGQDEPFGSPGCCKCQITTTVIDNQDWYYFPLADTSECAQCANEIRRHFQEQGRTTSQLAANTPTGSIDSILFN